MKNEDSEEFLNLEQEGDNDEKQDEKTPDSDKHIPLPLVLKWLYEVNFRNKRLNEMRKSMLGPKTVSEVKTPRSLIRHARQNRGSKTDTQVPSITIVPPDTRSSQKNSRKSEPSLTPSPRSSSESPRTSPRQNLQPIPSPIPSPKPFQRHPPSKTLPKTKHKRSLTHDGSIELHTQEHDSFCLNDCCKDYDVPPFRTCLSDPILKSTPSHSPKVLQKSKSKTLDRDWYSDSESYIDIDTLLPSPSSLSPSTSRSTESSQFCCMLTATSDSSIKFPPMFCQYECAEDCIATLVKNYGKQCLTGLSLSGYTLKLNHCSVKYVFSSAEHAMSVFEILAMKGKAAM